MLNLVIFYLESVEFHVYLEIVLRITGFELTECDDNSFLVFVCCSFLYNVA